MFDLYTCRKLESIQSLILNKIMMKTLKKLFVSAVIISALSLTSCSKENDLSTTNDLLTNEATLKSSDFGFNLSLQDSICFTGFPLEDLSDAEILALNQMREEELLARDIYLQLYEIYQYRVFDQISKSEEQHAAAIKALLDRYELADPALNHEIGVFTSSAIQGLYDQLLATAVSGVEALKVGATIEDVDIYDLQNLLANEVDNQDITFVFQKLLKGSQNHMRAFVKVLASQGETYTPQYITQEEFDAIIASGFGNQNMNGIGNKNGKGKRNGK